MILPCYAEKTHYLKGYKMIVQQLQHIAGPQFSFIQLPGLTNANVSCLLFVRQCRTPRCVYLLRK